MNKNRLTALFLTAALVTAGMTITGCGVKIEPVAGITVEAGQEYVFDVASSFTSLPKKYEESDFVADTSAVDTSVPGEYTVPVTYKEKNTYELTVTVQDTVMPEVELSRNYIWTSDVDAIDLAEYVNYTDATECTVALGYFERLSPAAEVDDTLSDYTSTLEDAGSTALLEREDYTIEEAAVYKNLSDEAGDVESTENAETTESTEEAEEVIETTETEETTDTAATEETEETEDTEAVEETEAEAGETDSAEVDIDGIYDALVTVTDLGGNTTAREIIIAVDTQAPYPKNEDGVLYDQEIEVDAADIDAEPEYALEEGALYDDFDGDVTEDATLSIEETDAENHVWTVTATVADRMGNEASYTYEITVKAKPEVKQSTGSGSGNTGGSSDGSSDGSSGGSGSGSFPRVGDTDMELFGDATYDAQRYAVRVAAWNAAHAGQLNQICSVQLPTGEVVEFVVYDLFTGYSNVDVINMSVEVDSYNASVGITKSLGGRLCDGDLWWEYAA